MTAIKQVSYLTRDFRDIDSLKTTTSVALKIHEAQKYFLHKVLTVEDENKRQGTASCKTRSEVRGGGKKPWKQKGTGRARSGSSSSPLWNGGGVVFGPKPRVYRKKINSKEKRLAVTTALSNLNHRITVLKNSLLNFDNPSTKKFISAFSKLDSNFLSKKILIILPKVDEITLLSSRNLPFVHIYSPSTLTLRTLLTADSIFISEEALLTFISP